MLSGYKFEDRPMLGQRRLADLSIRMKITAAFAALLLLFGGIGAASLHTFSRLNGVVRDTSDNYVVGVDLLSKMDAAVTSYRLAFVRAIANHGTPAALAALATADAESGRAIAANESKYVDGQTCGKGYEHRDPGPRPG